MAKMKQEELTLIGATPDELWLRYWEENLARQRAVQGQEDTSQWRAGGRATIANPNKEDGDLSLIHI